MLHLTYAPRVSRAWAMTKEYTSSSSPVTVAVPGFLTTACLSDDDDDGCISTSSTFSFAVDGVLSDAAVFVASRYEGSDFPDGLRFNEYE